MRVLYATVRDVRREREIKDSDTSNPTDDAWILDFALPYISARIEKITGLMFAPRLFTETYHAFGAHIDDLYNALDVGWLPVLAVSSLTIGGNTVDSTDYQFVEANHPKRLIALKRSAALGWSQFSDDWLNSIALQATRGYHRNFPDEAWEASGQSVQDDPLSDSATIVKVADSTVFSPGHLLQIENEWLLVAAVDASPTPDELTVVRGVRGSTAVTHTQGIVISIWKPEPQIVRAATRWASVLYAMRGQVEEMKSDVFGGTVTRFPQDAPKEVWNILAPFTDPSFAIGE